MKLWPSGKRKTELTTTTADSPVAEVKEYYDSSRQERQGLAWFLAFATLIVTVLIILSLFFGGRWTYRKIAHKDKPTPIGTQNVNQGVDKPAPVKPGSDTPDASTNSGSSAQTATPTNNQPAPASQAPSQPTPTATPVTGDAMPNTGPGDVMGIVAIATIAGALFYRFVLVREQ